MKKVLKKKVVRAKKVKRVLKKSMPVFTVAPLYGAETVKSSITVKKENIRKLKIKRRIRVVSYSRGFSIIPIRSNTATYSTWKIVAVLLALSLNWLGLMSVGETVAGLYDSEISTGNLFGAAKLDFILESGEVSPPGPTILSVDPGYGELNYGDTYENQIKMVDVASLSVQFDYRVRVEKTGGSDDFCNALDISALLNNDPVSSGDLITWYSPNVPFSDSDTWTFNVTLPVGAPHFPAGEFCEYKYIYEGWQGEFPAFPTGFHDVELAQDKVVKISPVCKVEEELVKNGSFEKPKVTHSSKWDVYIQGTPDLEWSVRWLPGPNIFGSLTRPASAQIELQRGVNGWSAQDGSQYAELDSDWGGPSNSISGEPAQTAISQKLITEQGQKYYLSFYFSPRPGTSASNNALEVNIDGASVLTVPATAPGSSTNWKHYGLFFTASDSESLLELIDRGTSNDSFGTFVDNVSVRCIPDNPAYLIVINEFLPNPKDNDNKQMPKGEWVELFNLSDAPIDVAGWVLYDNSDDRPLSVTASNSDNDGNLSDSGETIVPSRGYLIVYLNGKYNGWLNNTGGDSVRLYDKAIVDGGTLIDSYTYAGNALENKSYARIPDGVGAFVDPIPTPLGVNQLGDVFDLTYIEESNGEEILEENTEEVSILVLPETVEAGPASVEEETESNLLVDVISIEPESSDDILAETSEIETEDDSTELVIEEIKSDSPEIPVIPEFEDVLIVNAPLPKDNEIIEEPITEEPNDSDISEPEPQVLEVVSQPEPSLEPISTVEPEVVL